MKVKRCYRPFLNMQTIHIFKKPIDQTKSLQDIQYLLRRHFKVVSIWNLCQGIWSNPENRSKWLILKSVRNNLNRNPNAYIKFQKGVSIYKLIFLSKFRQNLFIQNNNKKKSPYLGLWNIYASWYGLVCILRTNFWIKVFWIFIAH